LSESRINWTYLVWILMSFFVILLVYIAIKLLANGGYTEYSPLRMIDPSPMLFPMFCTFVIGMIAIRVLSAWCVLKQKRRSYFWLLISFSLIGVFIILLLGIKEQSTTPDV